MNRPLADIPAATSPDCAAAQAQLSSYLDAELQPDEMNHIDQHLATCDHCRGELALLRAIVMAMTVAHSPTPSPTMRDRLLAQIVSETVIERVALLRQQRDGTISTIRHCKMETVMVAARRAVSETTYNPGGHEQLTVFRSETTRHSTTVYRHTVRS